MNAVGATLKPLVLVLSAASFALAVAACDDEGAQSAGPVPTVRVEAGAPPGSVNPVTRAEYVAQADRICKATYFEFHQGVGELFKDPDLEDFATLGRAAVRLAEEALVQLRALPQPEARQNDRIWLNGLYSLYEQQVELERRAAAAAAAGDRARWATLSRKRVDVTHRIYGVFPELQWCPVTLGA